ncbi:MATE family efflux transporter, partial [Faecalibaculum rodentium]|uniref:MATE family efflux transporter n=1 Tax=Faecalibaculum rodentium TaxID=1702221 RepID=UPI003EBD93B2
MIQDMTVGSPSRILLGFSAPMILSGMFQQLYNVVDSVVAGKFAGVDALAAVGLTGSLNFLVLGFIIGLSQGVGILCSQYFGSREYAQLRKSVTMSFYLNFSTGALLTVLSMVSARQLLVWMNTPAELMA